MTDLSSVSHDERDDAQALEYKQRILEALPQHRDFEPLMTLYLTDNTAPEEVEAAKNAGVVAFKLYPAGATTNSDSGVTDVFRCLPTLNAMADVRVLARLTNGSCILSSYCLLCMPSHLIRRNCLSWLT